MTPDLDTRLNAQEIARQLVLVCQSGRRSAQALAHLVRHGHTSPLADLDGGIPTWQQAGLPLRRPINAPPADSAIGPGIRWQPLRRMHFWLSAVYLITNILHLLSDILVPDARLDQIVLMVVLTLLGLLINIEGWHWWRQYH